MEERIKSEGADSVFPSAKPQDTTLFSEGYRSFGKLKPLVKKHKRKGTPPKQAPGLDYFIHAAVHTARG